MATNPAMVAAQRSVEPRGDASYNGAHGELGRKADAELQGRAAQGWSGAVIMEHRGRVVLRSGYGWANHERTTPFTTQIVAQVGSLTKQFTAPAIVDLSRRGKLRFTDPLAYHLPEVQEPARSITMHELLTHTSGLGEYCGGDFDRAPLADFIAGNAERETFDAVRVLLRLAREADGTS